MNKDIYICPTTKSKLKLYVGKEENGIIQEGYYQNETGTKYFIKNGIPDFTYDAKFSDLQKQQHAYYEANAEAYDEIQKLTFAIHNEDEMTIRKEMISQLRLHPSSKVLEVACGTGKDSVNIAALLNQDGELFVQDFSVSMLKQCQKKLASYSVPSHLSVGNASYLSFPNHYFDAVFSFGGLNVFDDVKRSLKEMVRVTKPGGRITVGDESMPPWLQETEFGKILINTNPLLKHKVPFECIPVEARDVSIRWIIGGIYYLISFTVGEGEPNANFDMEIPGKRGGTLRTRYYGKLEGLSSETKDLALQAREKLGISMHQWLDGIVKKEAKKILEDT